MNDVRLLHPPQWQLDGDAWHMMVGNRSVARLEPITDHPKYRWLSIIGSEFPDHGWDAVDFETLDAAQFDLEQWWARMCRGEAFAVGAD